MHPGRQVGRSASAACALAVLCACGSSFSLAGGDGGPGKEASPGGDGGSGADADAEVDGGRTAEAGPTDTGMTCPGFCASVPGMPPFCSDFDEQGAGTGPPSPWISLLTGGGGVQVTTAMFESCPNSLQASLPAETGTGFNTATGTAGAQRPAPFPSKAKSVVLDLWAYLPTTTSSNLFFFGLQPGLETRLGVEHSADGSWYLSSDPCCSPVRSPIMPPPITDQWNHMVLTVAFGLTGAASLTYDAMGGRQTSTYAGKTANVKPTTVTILVGLELYGVTEGPLVAYFDDIVLGYGN